MDFKVKKLLRDPDAIAALALAILFAMVPSVRDIVTANPDMFQMIVGLVFGGRFAVRAGGVVAAGLAASQAVDEAYTRGKNDGRRAQFELEQSWESSAKEAPDAPAGDGDFEEGSEFAVEERKPYEAPLQIG